MAAERGDLIWRWILVSDVEGMSLLSPSERLGRFSSGDYSIGGRNGRFAQPDVGAYEWLNVVKVFLPLLAR